MPSPETMALLEHLSRSGPLTVMEAARHFSRSQSAMSEILARAERRGLVEKYPDERDRRRHLAWLTPDGIDTLNRLTKVLSEERLERALETLDEGDRTRLIGALREFLNQNPMP